MKEITDAFTLFHKEINDKVKEEGREKRALSKGVCTSMADVVLYGLTAMALEGFLCTENALGEYFSYLLSYASLGFYYRVGSLVCFTRPKYLVLCLCHHSLALQSRFPSPRLYRQLGGTKGLAFVPTCRLLFQDSEFTRNMTGRKQRCRPRHPLFSWSKFLCLLLVQMHPLEVLGVDMAPGSLAVPLTWLWFEEVFV